MFNIISTWFNQYSTIIKAVGLVIIITLIFSSGVYVTHLYYTNQLNKALIAKQEAEKALTAKTAEINIDFIKRSISDNNKSKERNIFIDRYIPSVNNSKTCYGNDMVTKGFIEFNNAAVDNRELTSMAVEEINTSSEKTLSYISAITNENYTMCNKYINQLTSLQAVLLNIQKTYNSK